MSFGQNIQFLRKMRNKMTQEELAQKLGVSRQTVSKWELNATYPEIIGWDFPVLSQEQINVFNMHGYVAALVLPDNLTQTADTMDVVSQEKQKYIVITIKNPMIAPFHLIPNAYKVLMTHIHVNGINHKADKNLISCFEKEYVIDGIPYMDVYISVEEKES